jgi:lipopolysaccharide transport system ATP-binding protein
MSEQFAIDARGLGKRYLLGNAKNRHDTLRDLISDGVLASLRRRPRPQPDDYFWALRDANFRIAHGENVGFIGLNGAGKSTSLKILSRITEPTTGQVRINGRLSALLEVGTGFHGELSGRENIYLYGSILGMKKAEVRRKFDAIVEFSEISSFIDTPVKRYSSGMYVRLAFAVAAHLEPDILLLDEVLAVGDLPFQRKCIEFAQSLQRNDATILFVSHNMYSIKSMCERVIYLKKGCIAYDGPTDGGIALYEQDCRLASNHKAVRDTGRFPIHMTDIRLTGNSSNESDRSVFQFGECMTIRMRFEAREAIDRRRHSFGRRRMLQLCKRNRRSALRLGERQRNHRNPHATARADC